MSAVRRHYQADPTQLDLTNHRARSDHDPKWSSIYAGVTYNPTRGAIALRHDDIPKADYEGVSGVAANSPFAMEKTRNLVAGYGAITGLISSSSSLTSPSANLTKAQLSDMQARGMEVACHSRNHAANTTSDYQSFYNETLGALSDILTNYADLHCQSFYQPGVWTGTWNFDTLAKVDTKHGRLLQQFAQALAYVNEHRPTLDQTAQSGVSGITGQFVQPPLIRVGSTGLSVDSMTLVNAKAQVDSIVRRAARCCFLVHTSNLGQGGFLTVSEYGQLLDYIQTYITNGELQILTPTSLMYAQPASSPTSLIPDYLNTGTGVLNTRWQKTGTPTLSTTGGNTASYLQVDASNYAYIDLMAGNLRSLWVEAYIRAGAAGTNTPRFIVRQFDSSGAQVGTDVDTSTGGFLPTMPSITSTSTWTKIAFTVGVRRDAHTVRFWPYRSASGSPSTSIQWSDVKIWKI